MVLVTPLAALASWLCTLGALGSTTRAFVAIRNLLEVTDTFCMDSVKTLLLPIRTMCPGQKECDQAIDTLNTVCRYINPHFTHSSCVSVSWLSLGIVSLPFFLLSWFYLVVLQILLVVLVVLVQIIPLIRLVTVLLVRLFHILQVPEAIDFCSLKFPKLVLH